MSGPWEDFQTENGPWADFSSSEKEDPFDKIPGGHVKPPQRKKHTAADVALGVGEAAYGSAKAAVGGLVSPVTGLLMGAFGKGDAEKEANKAMQEWAYQPKTELGEEYLQEAGEFANRYLLPLSGLRFPQIDAKAAIPKEMKGRQLPPESVDTKLDRVEPTLTPAKKLIDPDDTAHPAKDFYTPSQLKFQKEALDAHNKVLADKAAAADQLQRVNDAQAAIEARRAALEQEVARQTNLDMNAAERARQERAPVPGLEAARMREIDGSIARTQELNRDGQQMGIVEDFGNNDPMARMPEMRIDENGIPIRADLSMEAQNLENPLQRNLWGDELGPALDQVRSLTEALDNMPPWEDIQAHFNRSIEVQNDFINAINEANRQADASGLPVNLGKGKGRSQSGGVDFDAFSKAIGNVTNKMGKFFTKSPDKFDLPVTPQDKIKSMPGVGAAIKDWIPEPPAFTDYKTKILAEGKDGPPLIQMIQSGGINTANKIRSSLMEGVTRWNLYAQKVSERTIRNQVQPLEAKFRNLSVPVRKEVAALMKREMFAEQRYTPEQLREAGISEKGIDAYNALRDQFNSALENLNAGRAAMGKKPVTPKEAYLASRWHGDWHVPIYDKEGKLVWYIREKTRGGAKNALEWLKKNSPEGLDWKKSEVTHRRSTLDPNSPRDIASAYKEFLDMLPEGDARVAELKQLYEEMKQSDAYDFMNTKKHFLNKSNIHGFLGDKPWKTEEANANELFTSQFQYLKEAHRWAETQKSMVQIKEFLSDPEINAAQPNNIALAHTYVQNALGMGVNRALADLESRIIKVFGGSRSQAYEATNALKNVFYLSALGLSPGFMIMNTLQPVLSVGSHRALSVAGVGHNPLKTLPLALGDTVAGMSKHLGAELFGAEGKIIPMTKMGREALRYAEENGLVSHNIFDENESLSVNRGVALAQKGLGWTISLSDKVGRLGTFMSFVHHLNDSGKFASKAELFQKAEDLTNDVMVDFHHSERPQVFNKMGLVGENMVPLKSFIFSYYNQFSKFIRMAQEGNPTPLMAFLGGQLMLGGMVNMPGMNEMEGMWNVVKNGLAKWFPKGYAATKDIPGPKEMAAANMPEVLAYGPASTLSGLNIYSRASTSIVDPERPFADMFPLTSLGNAAGDLATGNLTQAAWDIAPPAAKGQMETRMDAFKARNLETGEQLTDSQGKKKYLKASDITSNQAQGPARDEQQDIKRALGLRDFKETKERDINYTVNKNSQREETARRSAMNAGFNALVRGNKEKAREYFTIYARDFNGAESLERDLNRKIMEYGTTPQERLAMKRMSMPIVDSVLKRKELLGE